MTLGQKIKKLRTDKGLTQKDLADRVFVTFQTVSKWEKDENEPDVATLRELAKVFDCSLDYLLSEEESISPKEEKPMVEEEKLVVTPTPPVEEHIIKTVIIHEKELHLCAKCGKEIPEDELETVSVPHHHRVGRTTHTTYSTDYYHKACRAEVLANLKKAERKAREEKARKAKKRSFGWGIAGGGTIFIATLLILLLVPACKEVIHPGIAVLLASVASYGIFSMLYCVISGSYIADIFEWAAGSSIKFPGIIFSWSFEGLMWLIWMKFLFMVLGFFAGVALLLGAIALSSFLGMVSFPFILIHNINTDYVDAL